MTAKITASADGTYGSLDVGTQEAFRFGADTSGQLAGFRNKLINGELGVWQRGTNFNPAEATSVYFADRWFINCQGAGVTNLNKGGYLDSARSYATVFTGATGNTSTQIQQRIEADNTLSLASKVVTVSAWVYSADSRAISITLTTANAANDFTGQTVVGTVTESSPATEWRKVSGQITMTGTANGVAFIISYGAVGNGVVCGMAGAQLEEGSIATPFEQRPIGLELSLCQRYFEKVTSANATQYLTTAASMEFVYKVTKRVTPSVTGGSTSLTLFGVGTVSTLSAPAYQNSSPDKSIATVTFGSTGAIGKTGLYLSDLSASAEL